MEIHKFNCIIKYCTLLLSWAFTFCEITVIASNVLSPLQKKTALQYFNTYASYFLSLLIHI